MSGHRLRAGLALLALLSVALPGAAQDAGAPAGGRLDTGTPTLPLGSAVVTLDQDQLFIESRFGQAMQARAQQENAALLAENRRIEAALEQEELDLTARRPGMDPAEFALLAEAFDTKVEEIRTAQDAKSRDIARQQDEDRQRFVTAVGPVLGQLMTEVGAVAIIDKSVLILSLTAIDVTEAAVARVDAVLGDGSATVPPPADPAAPLPTPEAPTPP